MKIFYIVPVTERPSWGMGIIYDHVNMLNSNGYDAAIIKEKDLYVPKWLNIKVPVYDYNHLKKNISANDILVVPEAKMSIPWLKKIKCRKLLFIQNLAYVFESMPPGETHKSLGFEHVLIIMPHMKEVVEKHIGLPYTIIIPYVADYFFKEGKKVNRKRQILVYPKFFQIDFSIVNYIVRRHISETNLSWMRNLFHRENWSVKELKGLTHEQVAEEMRRSTFLISLNTFEALNTSVVEAMASGCIPFCYEGVGPRDFLEDGKNAIVFGNNEAYALAEAVCDWIDHFEEREEEYRSLQENGFKTASYYKRATAENQLIAFFNSFTNGITYDRR